MWERKFEKNFFKKSPMQPPNGALLIFKLPFLNGSYRNGVCRALWALLLSTLQHTVSENEWNSCRKGVLENNYYVKEADLRRYDRPQKYCWALEQQSPIWFVQGRCSLMGCESDTCRSWRTIDFAGLATQSPQLKDTNFGLLIDLSRSTQPWA